MADPLARTERATLTMLASWMGERFFRTFRPSEDSAEPFDALLTQRERRVGVTIGALWEDGGLAGVDELQRLVEGDIESDGGYVLWTPPGASLPTEEPRSSEFRVLVANGLRGLEPGERREVRIPARLQLAKVEAEGKYVSVAGGLSGHWTKISDGVEGAYHLDSRALHRLPEEEAELEIVISRVRDRAAMLNVEEVTSVDVNDYWLVSRLPADEPRGLSVIGAPTDFDASEGPAIRRLLRGHVRRANEQIEAGDCEFSVLLLPASLAHIEDEMATAALRGMNPIGYSSIDLIALVGDGQVRQMLQPRSLPWEG